MRLGLIKCLTIAITYLAFAHFSPAQSGEVNVTLCAVSMDSRIKDLKYISNEKIESINVYKSQRSKRFNYIGPSRLVFFSEQDSTISDGESIRTPIASCNIPSVSGNYMLLFSKKKGGSNGYNIVVLKDDWQSFSAGTYRFLNLSPFDIALKLEDNVHRIKGKDFSDFKPNINQTGNYKAQMVSLPKGQEPVPIFRGYLYFSDKKRSLYIITPRPGGSPGTVSFMQISDVVPRRDDQ